MSALLDRIEEAVSATAMARGFSAKLKEIASRKTDRLVIFKDNQPAAVIMNVRAYQELMDEIEELRIEATARDRLASFRPEQAVSHEDMRAHFNQGE